jgi:dipeptidyl aminopeptidase/acylaminoacyl peptidase
MADIKELFEMVETKNEPDLDAWQQQEERQRRSVRTRKVGAFLVAAALVVVVLAFAWNATRGTDRGATIADRPPVGEIPPAELERDLQDVAIVGLDGTPLGSVPNLPQDAGQLDLSPDHERLVFTTTMDGGVNAIATIDIDGSDMTVIKRGNVEYPTWSPDGSRIAFAWLPRHVDNVDVYVMDADGSDVERVTDDPFDDIRPRWTPDGRSLVYVNFDPDEGNPDTQWTTSADIWRIGADGDDATRLTTTDGSDTYPDVSPDGRRIVYFHREEDAIELRVMDRDGSGDELLLSSQDDGFLPRWSPDGTRIAFGTFDDVYRPDVSFGGFTNPEGVPLLLASVIDLRTEEISSVGEVGFAYDFNSPIWWSSDELLIHRVGH